MSADIYQDLSTLSDATRVRLLRLLEQEELGVGELARIVQLPQSTVSRHLKTLHTQGWVQRRQDGPASLLRMSAAALSPMAGRLWAVVREETEPDYAEDARRLQSLLALRGGDSREFFRRHAGQWAALRRDLYGEGFTLAALLSLLPEGLTVADLGCGSGEALAGLAPAVRRAIGIDREEAMLAAAATRTAGLANVELLQGDLDALPLPDGALDAALCSLVLHHVVDVQPVMAEVARVLKPGGRFVLLDMLPHDQQELRRAMGHQHLGFAQDTLELAAGRARLRLLRYSPLPEAPGALGPGLFVAVLGRDPDPSRKAAHGGLRPG